MSGRTLSEKERKAVAETALGWGKLLAIEAFPNRPGLDVTLADMEDIAALAAQAMVRGVIGTMTEEQAQTLDQQQPCPTCEKLCDVGRKPRTVVVRGGTAELLEPVAHCSTCRRDFFPSTLRIAD